jgi:hypothetical protein
VQFKEAQIVIVQLERIFLEKKLYEEAFSIFRNFNLNVQLVNLLLAHI